MSRNLRYKSPQTPVQKKKKSRRSSRNTDISSDDDYAGVDLISDDDESEPDVEGLEEQAIIDSEADDEDEDDDLQSTPRAYVDDDEPGWEDYDFTAAAVPGETFFEEHMARMHAPDLATEAAAWNATNSNISEDTGTPGRRVHFDLSDSDDSADADQDDDFFPDIFLDQNRLDPKFRRTIEADDDEDRPGSDDAPWNFNGSDNDTPVVQSQSTQDNDSDSDMSSGSSGYESDSDEGLTTDEDLPPEAKFAPAKSVLRRVSDASEDEEAEEVSVTRRNPLPKLVEWTPSVHRPFAVMDTKRKKLVMFQQTSKRRVSFNGTDNHGQSRLNSSSLFMDESSPMMSNSGNLMFGAMCTPLDQFAGSAMGPPEAFHPFTDIAADGTITHDSTSSFEDDDYADLLMDGYYNIDDFISLGDDSSDNDEGNNDDQDPSPSSDTAEPSTTPRRPTTATSEDQPQAHPLLDHFNNKDVVGSFRRNQTRHQQLTRNVVSTGALAFAGPYGPQGILRGIKGGRLEAANVPITPLRRPKAPLPVGSSPGSPLANHAANSKRKFTGEHLGHKRSRSAI